MNFRLPVIILLTAMAATVASCGSDDDVENIVIENTTLSNVEVSSFTLSPSNSVALNLDSVHFSIDLENAVIFNADSLPVGSNRGKAVATLSLPTVNKAEFVMKYDNSEDVVIDYLTDPSDSIDFGAKKLLLRIVSADEKVMREYDIKLNIHNVKPDSLYWDLAPSRSLPGSEVSTTEQKTVLRDGYYFTLSRSASGVALTAGANPAANVSWRKMPVILPATAVISSFSVADGDFFILDSNDNLYKSADCCTWTSTGASMSHIYGAYSTKLVGVKHAGGKYYHVTYPATVESEVPAGCPVSGTSVVMEYDSKWSDSPMITFTGGKTADGSLSGCTWGYDGTSWANISVDPMPAREGIAVCSYYEINTLSNYTTTTREVLYAFGGRMSDRTIDNHLYVSVDRGVHWSLATDNLQFAAYAPALANAQAIVCSSTLSVSASRAIKPISDWKCPYIYLFGGYNAAGVFNRGIFRAYINQFTFIPIQ